MFDKFKITSIEPNVSSKKLDELFYNFNHQEFLSCYNKFSNQEILEIGKKKCLDLFRKTVERVPAYKKFIKKNKINPTKIKNFDDFSKIPWVDKQNYLNKYSLNELIWDGNKRNISMISMSSGSSGKPFYWPRSIYQEYETSLTHELFLNDFFKIKRKKSLVIVAYSMGMYVAGTFTLNSIRALARKNYNIVAVSPGIDIKEVIKAIKKLSPGFDQTILAGYPPLVKDILDHGSCEGVDWKKVNIKFIFGGEGFSEDWRSYIIKSVNKEMGEFDLLFQSMNTYGSADAAILGHETPWSIYVRRLILNKGLNTKVFNKDQLPTIVSYNPLLRYFQEVAGELIFTANSPIPLVRYNIHDSGGILSVRQIKNILGHEEYPSEIVNKFPMVYLFGKNDTTSTLYGLKVYPENIKKAIEDNKIIEYLTGKFQFGTEYDKNKNQFLHIRLESKNTKLDIVKQRLIKKVLFNNIRKYNSEFNTLFSKVNKHGLLRISFVPNRTFEVRGSKHKWKEIK